MFYLYIGTPRDPTTSNILHLAIHVQVSMEPMPDLGHQRLEDHREVLHNGGLQDMKHCMKLQFCFPMFPT